MEVENDEMLLDSDEEEEYITAQKVLENLQNAWLNERLSPEILPHETEMLVLIQEQLVHMEKNMLELDKNDFRSVVHRMEMERIKYIITSYLRCRLKKIEIYTQHILNEEEKRETTQKRLSDHETVFAKEFLDNSESYYNRIALQYLPNLQRTDINQRIVKPNLMSHIFLKANTKVSAVVVGVDEEEVDLAPDSQHIIPYQLISDLVLNKNVQLI